MKAIIALTLAIFLISAPAPDSKTLSEISAGFLMSDGNPGLLAAQDKSAFKAISISKTETVTPQITDNAPTTR